MASRSSFWIMLQIRRSGISMGARRSTLPSIMRLVQQRPGVAVVSVRAERKPDRAQPQMMDAVQAVKVVEGALALLVFEAAVVLLVVLPPAGTEAVRWPRVLKCRAWRSSSCCWLLALIRIRN